LKARGLRRPQLLLPDLMAPDVQARLEAACRKLATEPTAELLEDLFALSDAAWMDTPAQTVVAPLDRIRRGAIVIARVLEDNKAGRSVLVIRSDALMMTPWIATLPFTTELDLDMPHWLRVEPTPENGLCALRG
jgi:hypothetical protein